MNKSFEFLKRTVQDGLCQLCGNDIYSSGYSIDDAIIGTGNLK